MNTKNSVVAIYHSHDKAEAAVKELQKSGFAMKNLSIVGKDYHSEEHVVGYYNTGDRMAYWGKLGAFWGGMFGLLFGSAFFFIPGLAPWSLGLSAPWKGLLWSEASAHLAPPSIASVSPRTASSSMNRH